MDIIRPSDLSEAPLIRGVAVIPSVLTASSPDQGGLPEQWQKPSLPIRKPSILRRGIPLQRWRLRYGHLFPSQAATANHNQSIKAIYYCMLFGPDTPISPVNSACSTPFTRKVFYVHLLRFLLLLPALSPCPVSLRMSSAARGKRKRGRENGFPAS